MKKIVIIGTGWYGLYTALLLQDNYDVIILEKNKEIFNNSSYYNQNRLHLGYHYPRSYNTRELCINGYNKFIDKFRDLVDFLDSNYYCISKKSSIDFNTYKQIYNLPIYKHTFLPNNLFNNIDGDIINTQEKIINPEKSKKYFENNIKCKITFEYFVNDVKQINNKVIINNDIECDLLFDCTYNQLNLSNKKYKYENTISFIYERISFNDCYDSLTIMDGHFFSLFPRDINKKLYSLTHVLHTPYECDNELKNLTTQITEIQAMQINSKIINDVLEYIPNFNKIYKFRSFFTSYKCKEINNNDGRNCIIEKNSNIISVNCGKITGIFDLESYIVNELELIQKC
jgi:hypothetical protein